MKVNVEVPDVVGLSYKEAKKILNDAGLEICMRDESAIDTEEWAVTSQIPISGVQILQGGSVIVE